MAISSKLPDAVITVSAGVGGMVAAVARIARLLCVQGGKLKREWQDNTQQLQNRNRCSPSALGLAFDMKWSSVTAPNPQRLMSAHVYLFTLTQRQWLPGLLFICNWNGTSIKNTQKEKNKALRPQLLQLGGDTRTISATYAKAAVALSMNLCTFDPYWALRWPRSSVVVEMGCIHLHAPLSGWALLC